MEDIVQTIEVLTSMIEVNDKRMKMYMSIAKKMHHSELKSLFCHYAEQSKGFLNELSNWRSAYGGFGIPQKKNGGFMAHTAALLKRWFGKSEALKYEEMEQEALKLYRSVLKNALLPHDAAKDIERQLKEFEKALRKLRTLQEQAGRHVDAREGLMRSHLS